MLGTRVSRCKHGRWQGCGTLHVYMQPFSPCIAHLGPAPISIKSSPLHQGDICPLPSHFAGKHDISLGQESCSEYKKSW